MQIYEKTIWNYVVSLIWIFCLFNVGLIQLICIASFIFNKYSLDGFSIILKELSLLISGQLSFIFMCWWIWDFLYFKRCSFTPPPPPPPISRCFYNKGTYKQRNIRDWTKVCFWKLRMNPLYSYWNQVWFSILYIDYTTRLFWFAYLMTLYLYMEVYNNY